VTAPPAAILGWRIVHCRPTFGNARKAYQLFRDDPQHPSLRFKMVHDRDPIYSVRVTGAYRAVGIVREDEITWFWIGDHSSYDRLLKSV
jgi:hypothetical protein